MARAEKGGGARRESKMEDLQEQLAAMKAALAEEKRLEKEHTRGNSAESIGTKDDESFGRKRPTGNGSSSTPTPPSEPRPAGSPRSPRARFQDASEPAPASKPEGEAPPAAPGLLRRGRTLARLRFGSSGGEDAMQLNMLMAAKAASFAARLKGGGNKKDKEGDDDDAENALRRRRAARSGR
tara:strand:+ start:1322 stop:1867 length:546 start_codon:yes stop_codon:yes gene_type:complete